VKSGGGGGEGLGARDATVGSRAGFLGGLQDLRGVEEQGGVNVRDVGGSEELDGDVRGRDGIGKFSEEQDIVGIESKERSENCATKGLNGGTDELKTVVVVIEDTVPGGGSEADLMTEAGHEISFWGRGRSEKTGLWWEEEMLVSSENDPGKSNVVLIERIEILVVWPLKREKEFWRESNISLDTCPRIWRVRSAEEKRDVYTNRRNGRKRAHEQRCWRQREQFCVRQRAIEVQREDTLDFTTVADKLCSECLAVAIASQTLGNQYIAIGGPATALNGWKVLCQNPGTFNTQLAAGAYPAGITGDVVTFTACLRKLL
jgi:hypothetical protein